MILWLIYIALEITIQSNLIRKGWKPIYIQLFIIRGMASIVHGIYLGVEPGWDYPLLVAFQATSFWILFDLGLNIVRGKDLFYQGKTSGWLDKLPWDVYIILKGIAAVVCLILLIIA